jgi:hypothetical protein
LIASETLPPPPPPEEPEDSEMSNMGSLEWFDTAQPVDSDSRQPQPPSPDVSEEMGSPAALTSALVFPEGYAARAYTRDSLTQLEQRYFDDLGLSSDVAGAQAVLDRFDLCHQAGFDCYEDAVAFVEGRVTLDELVRDRQDIAEVRRLQCEQQQQLEERMEARGAAQKELQLCKH